MQGSKNPIQGISNQKQHLGEQKQQETRKVSIIESTIRKQKIYFERIRGERQQTKQLNIHAKTLNEKYLKKCIVANELKDEDEEIFWKYKTMSPNFQTTKFLYDSISEQTKHRCRQYSRSSEIVKDILKSDRMFFNNKIIFLKFLKKVESGIDKPNISWKQEYFKNKKKPNNHIPLPLNIGTTPEKIEIEKKIPQQVIQQLNQRQVPDCVKNELKNEQPLQTQDGQITKNSTKTVRKLFMKKVGNTRTQPKPIKQIPAFGKSSFGGGFIFSLSSKNQ